MPALAGRVTISNVPLPVEANRFMQVISRSAALLTASPRPPLPDLNVLSKRNRKCSGAIPVPRRKARATSLLKGCGMLKVPITKNFDHVEMDRSGIKVNEAL